jgi:hypothetical protein
MLLTGCAANKKCGTVKTVEPGHTLSAWCSVTFNGGKGEKITVGNQSSPDYGNNAVITDFEYAFSTGATCRIKIFDSLGSSVGAFMRNMLTDLQAGDNYQVIIRWGWTKAGCATTPAPGEASDPHILQLQHLETNFVQGKFIHEIEATDTYARAVEGGISKIYGTDKTPKGLKTALTELLTTPPYPVVSKVLFKRVENDGEVTDANFAVWDDSKGPPAVWSGNGTNKLETARRWISGWVTTRQKIFVPVVDAEEDAIIFWERPNLDLCTLDVKGDPDSKLCIGTYVVNGGNDTPVIEFNPRFRWNFSFVADGGNLSSQVLLPPLMDPTRGGAKEIGVQECKGLYEPENIGSGQIMSTPPSKPHIDLWGRLATTKKAIAQAKHLEMDGIMIGESGIQASMVIVGDPRFPTQKEGVIRGLVLAIVFINPFYLQPGNPNSGGCGEWLAHPACNSWLTSKYWQIAALSHKISNGNYVINLDLRLISPDYDTNNEDEIQDLPDNITTSGIA